VVLQVLPDIKDVLKEDAGLEFDVSKTAYLPKGISQEAVFETALNIITSTLSRASLTGDVFLTSFVPAGFVGIGVPIDTDAFVQKFVDTSCGEIIDDVEKSEAIQDGLSTIRSSGFARLPDYTGILTLISC